MYARIPAGLVILKMYPVMKGAEALQPIAFSSAIFAIWYVLIVLTPDVFMV